MTKEIAVFRGSDGLTATLGEPGTVAVFHRLKGKWELIREAAWDFDAHKGLKELRRQMADMLEFIGTCTVFVAKTMTGLPYYELEKAGISTWEVTGEPSSFLNEIALQDDAAREEKPAEMEIKQVIPTELAPGHFSISIKEVQEKESGVTSKQVLLPLLRQKKFSILEIVCNHVPPWLDAECITLGLVSQAEKLSSNHFKVMVSKPL